MAIAEPVALAAGFALAHAAWNISDLPSGELLVPLAIVEKGNARRVWRFEAETQERAIAEGKAELAESRAILDRWAFAREATSDLGAGVTDVVAVSAWGKGMAEPIVFLQPVILASPGPFHLNGDAVIVIEGSIRTDAEASRLMQALYRGVQSHPHAGSLWSSWKVQQAFADAAAVLTQASLQS